MAAVRIALVTGTEGNISLANEIRLVKPALLYADQVVLYSPVAALLQAGSVVGSSDELTFEVLREVGPALDPAFSSNLEVLDALTAKRHKTKQELQLLIGLKKKLREAAADISDIMDGIVQEAGGRELLPALDSGLLTIHPLVDEHGGGQVTATAEAIRGAASKQAGGRPEGTFDEMFQSFMARLTELLSQGQSYPLFDDQVGSLIRAAVADKAIELRATPARRAKEASAASMLMEELPAFPHATVQEILDIREELRTPLIRFRAAVIEIERSLASAAHDEDFRAEVADLYRAKVAPALLELSELIADNRWLRQLGIAAADDVKGFLAAASVAAGVTTLTDLPSLVAAAFAVPTVAAAVKATEAKAIQSAEIQRHQLFFLHRTNVLLESL